MTPSTFTCSLCLSVAAVFAGQRLANAQPAGAVPETPVPADVAGTTDRYREARELYTRGEEAFRAKDLEAARGFFLRAWSLRRTYDVASVLGQVELSLGHPRDAAEHLDFAIRNFPPHLNPGDLQRVRHVFSRAEQQVGTVLARVDRAGAEVLVDGGSVGQSPLPAPLFLSPGKHTIEARQGPDSAWVAFTATPGVQRSLTLTLSRRVAAGSRSLAVSPVEGRASLTPLVFGGAVALAGAGFGLGFALAAANARDSATSLRATLTPGGCAVAASAADCIQLRDRAHDYDRNRKLSMAGFAVSATALVATAGYWFFVSPRTRTPKEGARASVRVEGAWTEQSAVLSVMGAW